MADKETDAFVTELAKLDDCISQLQGQLNSFLARTADLIQAIRDEKEHDIE